MTVRDGRRAMVWCEPTFRSSIAEVIEAAGLEVKAVGGPDSIFAGELATLLESERADDLRLAAQREDLDLAFIAATLAGESDAVSQLESSGLRVVSLEPLPGSLTELTSARDLAEEAVFAPLMRRCAGFRSATDVLAHFGEPRCVNIFFRSGKGQGSLYGRLFDAMDIIHTLCGEPEQLDAAFASPVPGLPGVPEALRGMRGSITINMRFSDNRCACVAASDQAGAWFRGVTVLGEEGCLRIHDDGFEWINAEGEKVDSTPPGEQPGYAALVADQINRLIERKDQSDLPLDVGRLLALCESARLSCRTGQSETPRKILEVLSRV
jgi:predicted dehydrogenase